MGTLTTLELALIGERLPEVCKFAIFVTEGNFRIETRVDCRNIFQQRWEENEKSQLLAPIIVVKRLKETLERNTWKKHFKETLERKTGQRKE